MRYALAIFMALHGIAHFVGFAVPWRLVEDDTPYSTTVLAGRVDLGEAGSRVFGLVWLAIGIGFVLAAVAVWMTRPAWLPLVLVVATLSLAASMVGWPDARIGVFINVALLLLVGVGARAGWL